MKRYRFITLLAFLGALCITQTQGSACTGMSETGPAPAPVICAAAKPSIIPRPRAETATPVEMETTASIIRHSQFRYRIDEPAEPSGEIVLLLHGSGGDESTLFPFARPIWPHAVLIGIRGRLIQDGKTRWYRRITPTLFDQKDVGRESDAFVDFLTSLAKERGYNLSRTTFVGYSNGANLLAVVMMEHPDLVRKAILMRSMPVLDKMPDGDLHKSNVLTISGENDTLYSPYAPALSSLLQTRGAKVESHIVAGSHMIGEEDANIITRWLNSHDDNGMASAKGKRTRK